MVDALDSVDRAFMGIRVVSIWYKPFLNVARATIVSGFGLFVLLSTYALEAWKRTLPCFLASVCTDTRF